LASLSCFSDEPSWSSDSADSYIFLKPPSTYSLFVAYTSPLKELSAAVGSTISLF